MTCVSSTEALQRILFLTDSERKWKEDSSTVPLAITDHYLSLIDKNDPADPLRLQVVPSCLENTAERWEAADPQLEEKYSVNSRLVHRYANRVAFLVTDICPMYCRHCFRRRFTGNFAGPATEEEIRASADYVAGHNEIREILLTGGDMLTLSDSEIVSLINAFRQRRPDLLVRICTRYPVSDPQRINGDFISALEGVTGFAPVVIMTQFNHPREISPESEKAVSLLRKAGYQIFNQSVLLKGVNDDADVLAQLCEKLLLNGIKPYYLFQGDLVSGTSHFRVPLEKGIEIYKKLSVLVSGLALPMYAIDLPYGGGKVTIGTGGLQKDGDNWLVTSQDGTVFRYPGKTEEK